MSLAAFLIGLSIGLMLTRRRPQTIAEMELDKLAEEFRSFAKPSEKESIQ